jgi:hypothetical protein
MDKEKGFYALDDSVLEAVTGGVGNTNEVRPVSEEVRVNLFGQGADSGVTVQRSSLDKILKLIWNH